MTRESYGRDRRGRDGRRRRTLVALGALGGAALSWLLIGGTVGMIVCVPCALGCAAAFRRLETPSSRRDRQRALADLPLVCDLLAAALRAGAPLEHAVGIVAVSLGGPLAQDLRRVRDSLRIGIEPRAAWSAIRLPEGARLADAVTRGADSGAAVARALGRIAEDLRSARMVAVETASSRVGVLIVLPLGLCFLPAFVLAGIAPVIVAVLGDVLR